MTDRRIASDHSHGRAGGSRPPELWLALVWGRMAAGMVLSCLGGIAFGYAWTSESAPLWAAGGITLLLGVLLVLSGIYARSHPPAPVETKAPPEEPVEPHETLVPLLGAILVYKLHLITHKQLQQALAEQLRTTPKRRLGEILVLKGLITASELEEALALQHQGETEPTPQAV